MLRNEKRVRYKKITTLYNKGGLTKISYNSSFVEVASKVCSSLYVGQTRLSRVHGIKSGSGHET